MSASQTVEALVDAALLSGLAIYLTVWCVRSAWYDICWWASK